jgi:hypothetical protein
LPVGINYSSTGATLREKQKYYTFFVVILFFWRYFFGFRGALFLGLVIFGVEWASPKPEFEKICVGDGFVIALFVLFAHPYRVVTRDILLQFAKNLKE